MTAVINAKTAKGAATQTLRALHKMMDEMGIPRTDAGIRVETEFYHGYAHPRKTYFLWWEGNAPYEWPIVAAGGGDIWGEEITGNLSEAYRRPATFDFQDRGTKWGIECENICTLMFYPTA